MKKLFRLLKVVLVFFAALVFLFSAYNIGLIGQEITGREAEQQALSQEEPYFLYFYSSDCVMSRLADTPLKEMQSRLKEQQVDWRWILIDVEEENEMEFSWHKQVQVTPTLFLYDEFGHIWQQYAGSMDWLMIEQEILEAYHLWSKAKKTME